MPKVLRILNRFNLGGPTYNASLLTKYMHPDFETLLIGGQKDESEGSSLFIAEELGLKPIVIEEMRRSIHPIRDRIAYLKIKKIIQEFKPDIVHTHASKAGTLGRKAAFKCNVPVVIHTFHGHVFHSYFNSIKTGLIKRLERNLAAKSDVIIAISEQQKHELSVIHKICDPSKIRVVPLGFDLEKFHTGIPEKRKLFRDKYLVEDDEIVISIVGRLVPVKNHAFFIEVAKRLMAQTTKKLRFFIVGDGEEKENIVAKLNAAGLTNVYWPSEKKKAVVTLTSWSKEIDVVNAGSDIIVLTSLNEGTPVSLIEAQAAGKPIVSTRTGGIGNIVLENKSALLTDVDDVDGFVREVLNLVENDSIRLKMSDAAMDFVMNEFGYKVLCKRMELIYREFLAQKGINV